MLKARYLSAGYIVAQFEGRLDATTAAGAETELAAMVAEGPVVADMQQVRYISSMGLRVLLKAARLAKEKGGRLAVAGLQPAVREVFETAGFDRLIATFATLAEATAAD
nr:STAS domain-containing protein [uncultured Rhodopila sp.]